jgi:hypothetical protein
LCSGAALGLPAACGDAKAASRENLKEALTALFEKNGLMLRTGDAFPLTLSKDNTYQRDARQEDAALVSAQLLDRKEAGMPPSFRRRPRGQHGHVRPTTAVRFRNPPTARAVLAGGSCAGHNVPVDRFTEPVSPTLPFVLMNDGACFRASPAGTIVLGETI